MNFSEKMIDIIANSRFCYAKEGGQGFVAKDQCKCNRSCQSCLDEKRFRTRFDEVGKELGYTTYPEILAVRKEILEILKKEFEDSHWYKNNVIE